MYAVSSSATTGSEFSTDNENYFKKFRTLALKNPVLIGFGIKDQESFRKATQYMDGGIIGSAVVNILTEHPEWVQPLEDFIKSIR